jgi:cation:H+ antiporter
VVVARFLLSALAVIAAGIATARFGDVIAARTRLGGLVVGTVLLAAGSSLPELVAGYDAVRLGVPDLAAGNLFGSSMVNIFLLGLLDLVTVRTRLLHRVAITHSLTAALATFMVALAALFILLPLRVQVAGIDLEGVVLLVTYIGGTRLIQRQAQLALPPVQEPEPRISLLQAALGLLAAFLLLLVAAQGLVTSAEEITARTGQTLGFFGVAVLPLITCMPELVSSIEATRIHAYDLAVGNLFGSCVFNMTALAIISLLTGPGSLFATVSPGFVAVALLVLVLISLALLATLGRAEVRILHLEVDALLIVAIYLGGLYLLYREGLLVPRG